MILFIDGLALFILLVLAIIGYQRGFVEELGRLLGLFLAMLGALRLYLPMGNLLVGRTDWDGKFVLTLSFIMIFLLILFLLRLVIRMIQLMILSRSIKLADRLLGFIFGFGKGSLIMIIIVWLLAAAPAKSWVGTIQHESRLYLKFESGGNLIVQLFSLEKNLSTGQKVLRKFVSDDAQPRQQLIKTAEPVD